MIILKIIRSILLLPVWILATVIWLPIHLVVYMMSLAGGLLKGAIIVLAILSIAFGMWQNSLSLVLVTIVISAFIIGINIFEALFGGLRRLIGRTIFSY